MQHPDLPRKVRAILTERGFESACRPLDVLAGIIEETEQNINRKVFWYKWPGLILLALVPLISAALSILIADDPQAASLRDWIYGMSFTLTLLTVVNSIFRPSERFKEACRMGVDFQRIKSDFLADIENLPNVEGANVHVPMTRLQVEEAHLHTLISKFNKLVAPYQKELISMFLPEVAVEGKNGASARPVAVRQGKSLKPEKIRRRA